jgi:hypothetical protein
MADFLRSGMIGHDTNRFRRLQQWQPDRPGDRPATTARLASVPQTASRPPHCVTALWHLYAFHAKQHSDTVEPPYTQFINNKRSPERDGGHKQILRQNAEPPPNNIKSEYHHNGLMEDIERIYSLRGVHQKLARFPEDIL